MADKRCDNGHFIDESWDICPYCPQEVSEPEIAVVRPSRASEAPPAPARPVAAPLPTPVAIPRATVSPMLQVQSPPPQERTVAASKLDQGPHAQKRYVVGWLIGLNGSARGESHPVRMGRNVIGRDRRSDIVINDDQASSHHADLVFRPEERRFILMDHNSTNGTYVNEAEIEPRRDLAGKDVVRIGSHRFLFMPLCHDGFHWDDEGPLQ
ncbi:MAG TPA: FHA domain-containing protein [Thermoanaerobaculia bacterium]|nr:FHA domain-containing protein [Thermoanaerobaculia bacterium]